MIGEVRYTAKNVRMSSLGIWCDKSLIQGQESVCDGCSDGVEPL
jgi:hypothetical protein